MTAHLYFKAEIKAIYQSSYIQFKDHFYSPPL